MRVYERALDAGEVAADKGAPIQTPATGPIAAYSFDEGEGKTLHDMTGTAHDGAIEGAAWARGKYGGALEFDGEAEDLVTIPGTEDLQLEEFTIEAWVRPSDTTLLAPVVAKLSDEDFGYALYAGGDSNAGRPEGYILDGKEIDAHAVDDEALPEHAWSHIAVTNDGNKIRLYVNGELEDTGWSSDVKAGGAGPLTIGGNEAFEAGEYFSGKIDEVRVYERALDAGDIVSDMRAETKAPTVVLTGPLAEGIKEELPSYSLKISASDGTLTVPGTGVRRLEIAVDGKQVFRAVQGCPLGNCPMERTWAYVASEYLGFEHHISVSALDQVGNKETIDFAIVPPDGDIGSCDAKGQAPAGPTETEEIGSGGELRIYKGKEFDYELPIPPASFDPLTANDEELELYAFPPRPTDSESLDEWTEEMQAYQGTAVSDLCTAPRVTNSASEEFGPSHESLNWSGYVARAPTNENTWVGITGSFKQPSYHPTKCKYARLSTWVGLGNKRLVQGGTEIDSDHRIHPWIEYLQPNFDSQSVRLPGLNIKANHRMRITLFYQVANERLVISYFDTSTGESTKAFVKNLPHDFYDGTTGEFIDERPSEYFDGVFRGYYNLPDYDRTEWYATKLFTKDGKWQKLAKANPHRLAMVLRGKILSAPGYLKPDGKSFTNNFVRCAP